MKLDLDPRLPVSDDIRQLKLRLSELFRQIAVQIGNLSEGRISGKYTAGTVAPTTGSWAQGDTVTNSAPTEAGTAGSKYVITGWVCVSSGTPGTWVATRSLTGN